MTPSLEFECFFCVLDFELHECFKFDSLVFFLVGFGNKKMNRCSACLKNKGGPETFKSKLNFRGFGHPSF